MLDTGHFARDWITSIENQASQHRFSLRESQNVSCRSPEADRSRVGQLLAQGEYETRNTTQGDAL